MLVVTKRKVYKAVISIDYRCMQMNDKITQIRFHEIMHLFNKKHLNDAQLEDFLLDFGRRNLSIDGDLNNPPRGNDGLTICQRCETIYWITDKDPVCYVSKGSSRKGPYCSGCARYIASNG